MTADGESLAIKRFEEVPAQYSGGMIRLPRCENCFEEVHDYARGSATCIVIRGKYSRMEGEQLARWDEAERLDRETRPLDEKR